MELELALDERCGTTPSHAAPKPTCEVQSMPTDGFVLRDTIDQLREERDEVLALLQRVETSRNDLARQQGQYKGRIAKVASPSTASAHSWCKCFWHLPACLPVDVCKGTGSNADS